jgi:hypothetical protein
MYIFFWVRVCETIMRRRWSVALVAAIPGVLGACTCSKTDLSDRLPYVPVGYGAKCDAHDASGFLKQCGIVTAQSGTFANGAAYLANAPYCAQPWCYVDDPAACEAAGVPVHRSFSGENLYYSYEACGGIDFYTPEDRDCQCVTLDGSNGYGVYLWPNGSFVQGKPEALLATDPRREYRMYYLNPGNAIPYGYLGARTANSFAENGVARSSIFTRDNLYDANMVDIEFNYYGKHARGSLTYCITTPTCPTSWQSPFVLLDDPAFPLGTGLPFTSVQSAPDAREHAISRAFPRERATPSVAYPRMLPLDPNALGAASHEINHYRRPWASDAWPTVGAYAAHAFAASRVFEHVATLDGCKYECDLRAACRSVVYHGAAAPLMRNGDTIAYNGLEVVHERTGVVVPRFPIEFDVLYTSHVLTGIDETPWETVAVGGGSFYNLPAGRCVLLGVDPLGEVGGDASDGADWSAATNLTRLTKTVMPTFEERPWSLQQTINSAVRTVYDMPFVGGLARTLLGDPKTVVDLRPQDRTLAIPSILNGLLQSDKVTTWNNYMVDPLAVTSIKLVMVMDRNSNYHARLFVPNVIVAYTPTSRECDPVSVTVDNDLLDATRVSDCPPESRARARHTSFFRNGLEDYRILHGEAVLGTEDNIMRYYIGACKERERQQVVYNGTHAFVAFGYTSDDTWSDNVNLWNNTDGRLCSHPYLTGRVHCGILKVALRRLARLTDDTLDDARGDPCRVFMQGRGCEVAPKWVFSGLSQGATCLIIFMELLRTYLRDHHGISTGGMDIVVQAFQPAAAFDDDFVAAYEANFGPQTRIFLDRSDPFVLGTQLVARQVDTEAVVTSAIGGCGNDGTAALLSECIDVCDTSAATTGSLLGCLSVIIASFNPEEHYATPLRLLRHDQTIPREYTTNDDTFALDIISFASAAFDQFTRTSKDITSLEAISAQDHLPHVCAADINANPWAPNSVTALATVLLGEVYTWCLTHRMRLLQRIRVGAVATRALDAWDTVVCRVTADAGEETPRTIFVQHEALAGVRWNRTATTPRVD